MQVQEISAGTLSSSVLLGRLEMGEEKLVNDTQELLIPEATSALHYRYISLWEGPEVGQAGPV